MMPAVLLACTGASSGSADDGNDEQDFLVSDDASERELQRGEGEESLPDDSQVCMVRHGKPFRCTPFSINRRNALQRHNQRLIDKLGFKIWVCAAVSLSSSSVRVLLAESAGPITARRRG